MKNKVIVLIGPTAIGKTDLSIEIAKKYDLEVISGDSMQIYKDMDIGTGKITHAEMDNIVHHMIDIISPEELYSVADFKKDVEQLMEDTYKKGKIPFIVGGTGFYIQALLYDFNFDKNNDTDTDIKYDALIIGLNEDRETLYGKINERVEKMFQKGLLKEVEYIMDNYTLGQTAKGAIGYKEFFPYFDGKITMDEVKSQIQKNSRNYAKRQLTYFRNKLPVTWFLKEEINQEDIFNAIDCFIGKKI